MEKYTIETFNMNLKTVLQTLQYCKRELVGCFQKGEGGGGGVKGQGKGLSLHTSQ